MKKILLILIFIFTDLFSDSVCCDAFDPFLVYDTTEPTTFEYFSETMSDSDIRNSGGTYPYDGASYKSCRSEGVDISTVYGLEVRGGVTVKKVAIENYTCKCTQPTTPKTELEDAPLGNVWINVRTEVCSGSVSGDIQRYDDAPHDMRTFTSQSVGCCGMNIEHYIASSISCAEGEEYNLTNGSCEVTSPATCPTGQEAFEGTCYETCGVDGLVIDGACVERGTCRTNFVEFIALDAYGNDASCNVIDGDNDYSETYQLFPNESGSAVDCCGIPINNNDGNSTDGNSTDGGTDNGGTDNGGSDGGGSTDGGTDNGGSDGEESTTDIVGNNTSNDVNGTGGGDGSEKAIKDFHADNNANHVLTQEILGTIGENITTQSTVLGDKIDITNDVLNDIKTSLASIDSKGNDDVVGAVNDASSQAHTDSEGNKFVLEEIRDALTDGREKAKTSNDWVKDGLSELTDNANNNYSSVVDSFNSLLSSYSDTPPTFRGTGDSVFSTNVYGSDVIFDLSLFANLRQYFDIIFLLMLAWLNFKIYRWMLEFLIKIGV